MDLERISGTKQETSPRTGRLGQDVDVASLISDPENNQLLSLHPFDLFTSKLSLGSQKKPCSCHRLYCIEKEQTAEYE